VPACGHDPSFGPLHPERGGVRTWRATRLGIQVPRVQRGVRLDWPKARPWLCAGVWLARAHTRAHALGHSHTAWPSGNRRRGPEWLGAAFPGILKGPWCHLEGGWIGETTDFNFSSLKLELLVSTGQTGGCYRSNQCRTALHKRHLSDRCLALATPVWHRAPTKTASSSSWLLAWTKLGERFCRWSQAG
jgi:hypothetical protein